MTSPASLDKTEQNFEAEVSQLLKLMVHSVYSNKDIFLRELISNAADACEKLRYLAIQDPALLGDAGDLKITLKSDESGKTLTVIDNGIGMNREDLTANLGTIARSGTKAFLEGLEEKGDGSALIGQFGVGFYSAFMVAGTVTVYSRKAGEEGVSRWTSSGEGTFTVEAVEAGPDGWTGPGTIVVLTLTEEASEYANPQKVEDIVRAYSAHVPVPIHLEGKEKSTDESGTETTTDFDRMISNGGALWTKSKSEIEADEYKEFYSHLSGQFDEPAATIHYRAEGRQEYTVLSFIPSMKPFDLFNPERKGRMKLYVRRVFISDEVEILPAWLRFVRGLVDSEDLPLNISRELLQDNPLLEAIKTGVTKRILTELKKLSEKDVDTFTKVWEAFGAVIKEGLYEDVARRDDIYELCRFKTSKSDGEWRSLDDYIEAFQENQTAIYYALGDSIDKIAASPHLEGYKARNIEVLFLTDPVDAFWVRTALGFKGKPFKSITQGSDDLDAIGNTDTKEDAEQSAELGQLFSFMNDTLGDLVSQVRASSRLAESSVCLVAADHALDKQLQKILKDQPDAAPMMGNTAPILEVNPKHPTILKLNSLMDVDNDRKLAEEMAVVLYGQACILDGEQPAEPAKFSEALGNILDRIN